jgi:hypothetical protein
VSGYPVKITVRVEFSDGAVHEYDMYRPPESTGSCAELPEDAPTSPCEHEWRPATEREMAEAPGYVPPCAERCRHCLAWNRPSRFLPEAPYSC